VLAGRRVRSGRCVRPTAALVRRRARRCTRFVAAGVLTRRSRPAGLNRIPFTGRIGRRALALGEHRLTATATDTAGNRSRARTVRFRTVRP
jgi:hypothetical protein